MEENLVGSKPLLFTAQGHRSRLGVDDEVGICLCQGVSKWEDKLKYLQGQSQIQMSEVDRS